MFAQGAQQDNLGIYIKSILNEGPAEMVRDIIGQT